MPPTGYVVAGMTDRGRWLESVETRVVPAWATACTFMTPQVAVHRVLGRGSGPGILPTPGDSSSNADLYSGSRYPSLKTVTLPRADRAKQALDQLIHEAGTN